MARGPSIEKSMLGDEPTFEGGGSRTDIARGFLYYSYKYSIRDTKKWIVAWMKDNGYTETQQAKYRASSHTDITQTKASIARMLSRGLKDCPLRKQLIDHIDLVLSAKKSAPQSTAKTTSSDSPPNIVIADIDDILDDFYKDNYKTVYEIEVSTESKVTDIRNAHAYYTELLNEVNEVVEGYEHLKRAQKKRYIEQLELIINELVLKGALVKRRKPVRKKKAPSAEKQVAKVLYPKDHGNYSSIDPTAIVESNILWVYNVKYKRLAKYVAPAGQKLQVKTTTLKNVDKCIQYVLRKPDDFLPTVMTGTRRDIDKMIKTIKTKPSEPNGRINGDTLILRGFK